MKGSKKEKEPAKLEELKQLKEKAAKAEENHDKYLRAAAELENYRRRATKDREQAVAYAETEALRGLLPVLDNLERALAQARDHTDTKSMLQGLELMAKQLQSYLGTVGLKPMESVGKPFDPHSHEAIMHVPSADHPDNTVAEEVQKGYTLHGRVIRHAMVKVVDNPAPPAKPEEPETQEKKEDTPHE